MPDDGPDIAEEQAILGRLAQAHKEWRDRRPSPSPQQQHPSPEEEKARIARMHEKIRYPEPPDVAVLREAQTDPLSAAIWSQLSVVGWRLYAKGGAGLITAVYRGLERDEHPGFAAAASRAWNRIGVPGDPRGVWTRLSLL